MSQEGAEQGKAGAWPANQTWKIIFQTPFAPKEVSFALPETPANNLETASVSLFIVWITFLILISEKETPKGLDQGPNLMNQIWWNITDLGSSRQD